MNDVFRVVRILGFTFLVIGVVVLGVVIAFSLGGGAGKGMATAAGQVVSVDNFKPTVRFATQAGQSVTAVGPVTPGLAPGQQVRVEYDPANPQHFFVSSGRGSSVLFGVLGAFFALLGLGMVIFTARRSRGIAWLRKNGMKVSGRIVDVKRDSVEINNKPAWKVSLEWTANGVTGRGTARLTKDPQTALAGRSQLDVWVDPKNPKSYWVDTDFLK